MILYDENLNDGLLEFGDAIPTAQSRVVSCPGVGACADAVPQESIKVQARWFFRGESREIDLCL